MAGLQLRGVGGEEAVKAFVTVGGVPRAGKGDHVNIKMPNGQLVTIPCIEISNWLAESCYSQGRIN